MAQGEGGAPASINKSVAFVRHQILTPQRKGWVSRTMVA
jgi:hypothetical protein